MLKFLNRWLPVNGSAHGPEIDQLLALMHWLMAVLFVGWALYFVYVLFRFRAGRNPEASYTGTKSHFSTYIEVGVVVIEVILLVGFAIPAWARWVTPHMEDADALQVRVVGEQFAWNVQYPGADGIFGRRDIELVDSSNPLGLDRSDPFATGRHHDHQPAAHAGRSTHHRVAVLQGCHPQFFAAGHAGEAGLDSRYGDPGPLHTGPRDAGRVAIPCLCGQPELLGDRLRPALRAWTLPYEGLLPGPFAGQLRHLDGGADRRPQSLRVGRRPPLHLAWPGMISSCSTPPSCRTSTPV